MDGKMMYLPVMHTALCTRSTRVYVLRTSKVYSHYGCTIYLIQHHCKQGVNAELQIQKTNAVGSKWFHVSGQYIFYNTPPPPKKKKKKKKIGISQIEINNITTANAMHICFQWWKHVYIHLPGLGKPSRYNVNIGSALPGARK